MGKILMRKVLLLKNPASPSIGPHLTHRYYLIHVLYALRQAVRTTISPNFYVRTFLVWTFLVAPFDVTNGQNKAFVITHAVG